VNTVLQGWKRIQSEKKAMQQTPQETIPPPLVRICALGPMTAFRYDPQTGQTTPITEKQLHGKSTTAAFAFLHLLISQPHRYAPRDWVLEQFWPESERSKANKRMDDVTSLLRSLLSFSTSHAEELLCSVRGNKQSGSGYRLAGYPLIWLDTDAFLWHMQHAALYQQMGDDPLPFLETAYRLGSRGKFLVEEPYSTWAEERREELEGTWRLCVHQITRLYRERGRIFEAELAVRSYWTAHLMDEDALRLLLDILGEQERYQEAQECYRKTCQLREQEGEAIDPRTHDLAEYWRSKPLSRQPKPIVSLPLSPVPPSQPASSLMYESALQFLQAFQNMAQHFHNEMSGSMTASGIALPPFFQNTSAQIGAPASLFDPDRRGIIEKNPNPEGGSMDKERREMLQQGIGLAGTSLFIPVIGNQELIADIKRVLSYSGPGEQELRYLEQKIRYYWLDYYGVTIAPTNLVRHVNEYVRDVMILLQHSLLPSTRTRLCACLSQGVLLIGVNSYALGQFQTARQYYQVALEAAHEADNNALKAETWCWDSYAWMRSDEPNHYQQALSSMLNACGFASLGSDLTVQGHTLAASAEVYGYLKEKAACIQVLKAVTKLGRYGRGDYHHIHQFDEADLHWYEGISLQQFDQPSDPDSHALLEEAEQALQKALSQLGAVSLQRAFYTVDMAQLQARKGEVEAACKAAREVVGVADTSASVRHKLVTVRTLLDPYADVQAVKDLDRDMGRLVSAKER
jgi:DNA-binding SARP family transcriptional activator